MGSALFTIAIPQEMQFIHEYLSENGGETVTPFHKGRSHYTFTYTLPNGEDIDLSFHVMNEMGNVASASISQTGISQAQPYYCFLLGIAGSIDEVARLGDVVIATSVKHLSPDAVKKITSSVEFALKADEAGIVENLSAEISSEKTKKILIDPRKKLLESSYLRYIWRSVDRASSQFIADDYLNYFGKLKRKPPLKPVTSSDIPNLNPNNDNPLPSVHRGTILGSDSVVDSDEYVKFIKDRDATPERSLYYYKSPEEAANRTRWFPAPLLAVDMETYGFFRMAQELFGNRAVPGFFSIRGISDLASDKSQLDDNTEGSIRRKATENALIVALDMLYFLVKNRARSR